MSTRVWTGGSYNATTGAYSRPGTPTGSGPLNFPAIGYISLVRGQKRYELSNHLGNVLAVVSDRKLQVTATWSTAKVYAPDVLSFTDYYAFGWEMPGRSGGSYRYGFNGQEEEPEFWGGAISFEYRVQDPRSGRFFSVDPIAMDYPWYTPYQVAGNMMIMARELEGLEPGYHTGYAGLWDQFKVYKPTSQSECKRVWDECLEEYVTIYATVMAIAASEAAMPVFEAGVVVLSLRGAWGLSRFLKGIGYTLRGEGAAWRAARSEAKVLEMTAESDAAFAPTIKIPTEAEMETFAQESFAKEWQRQAKALSESSGGTESSYKGANEMFGETSDLPTIWGANMETQPGIVNLHGHNEIGSSSIYIGEFRTPMLVEDVAKGIKPGATGFTAPNCNSADFVRALSKETGLPGIGTTQKVRINSDGAMWIDNVPPKDAIHTVYPPPK